MNVKPIRNYKDPIYPDKQMIIHMPDLLKKTPDKWNNKMIISTVLSSVLFAPLIGCSIVRTAGTAPIESRMYISEDEALDTRDYLVK